MTAGDGVHRTICSDNDYSSFGPSDFYAGEVAALEISQDTGYEMKGVAIDVSNFTNGATLTIKFYRSFAAAGASYKQGSATISHVVGTDPDSIEFGDWSHYGYTKIGIQSDNVNDIAVSGIITYMKEPLE